VAEQILQVPLDSLCPSDGNRRVGGFDPLKLEQLAESIRAVGVQQPAVVRAHPNGPPGTYEIVAGERRWKASAIAGLETLPCVVREIDDVTVLRIQTIENLQREDIHPLDEADGYARLIDRAGYDVEHLAQEVGRSASYVYQRLKLRDLSEEARQAFIDGKLAAGHAILIARLQENQQKQALKYALEGFDYYGQPCSIKRLNEWIRDRFFLELNKTAFRKDDADLVSKAGACTECPKRTGYAPALYPEIEKVDYCLDPKCFNAKCDAILARRREELKGEAYLEACKGWQGCPKGALADWAWEECRKKDEGAQRALIVNGPERGRLTWGRERRREAYTRFDSPEEEAAWNEERGQEELQRKARTILSKKIIQGLMQHYEAMPVGTRFTSPKLLGLILTDYFFDDIGDEVLKKYGLVEDAEETTADQLLERARALPADKLELLLIECILESAAPGYWNEGEEFFAFAAEQGLDMAPLEEEARREAEGPEEAAPRRCRVCGCTDDDCRQCIERTGEPCHWVEEDLCSACAVELRR